MNFIQHTRAAHEQLTRQPDATPFHVSLYWALFFEWNANRFPESLALDHEHLMSTAHIGNRKTYRSTTLKPGACSPTSPASRATSPAAVF